MRLKLLLVSAGLGLALAAMAAPKESNYGTDICTQLVIRANSLYNKGKYAESKVLYEQALATGDSYYAKKCATQLRMINSLLSARKKNPSQATVFTISQDTVRINCLGGDYPIHVEGMNWRAEVPAVDDWCKIDVNHRNGLVKIYCRRNESVSDRSARVTITNGNGRRKVVEVISEGSPEILRSSAQNLTFTPGGETSVVDIDANTDWEVADVPEWLRAIKGRDDIQFTASPNDNNRDRIARVKVETPSHREITINIIQGATLDSLAFNKNDLHFGPDGGEEYVHVLTNADDWKFGDFPHWCQLEKVDSNTIKVRCTPNQPVDMPREASINITTGTQTLGINVYQAPKPIFNVIPTEGIGGRKVSFGFSAGYLYPMISSGSSGDHTYSAVNYLLGGAAEQASYTSSGGVSVAAFADIRLYKNLYLNAGLNFQWYRYRNHINGEMPWIVPQTSTYYLKGDALLSFKEEYTIATMDVPITVSYRIPVTRKSHVRVDFGPVLSLGLSSRLDFSGEAYSSKMYSYKIINGRPTDELYANGSSTINHHYDGEFNLYSRESDFIFRTSDGANGENKDHREFDASPYGRVNFGLRVGAGYEFMGISLNLSYQCMLTNMANKKFWDGDRWTIFGHASELMTGYHQRHGLLLMTLGYTFRY